MTALQRYFADWLPFALLFLSLYTGVNTNGKPIENLILMTSNLKAPHTMGKQTYQERKEKYLGWIRELAKSQGFYGRLLEQLENNDIAMEMLLENDFKEPLDMVLWLEC